MLDARPDLQSALLDLLARVGAGHVRVSVNSVTSPVSGRHFRVRSSVYEHHAHDEGDRNGHHGVSFEAILSTLDGMSLPPAVLRTARGIYSLVAEAESAIHHTEPSAVHLHELGGWDSIIDIVAAAWVIDALGLARWSIGALPWGGGTVKTDHGILPCPAPATLSLLRGYAFRDDGVTGERVTPTGAAIVKYLAPSQTSATHAFRVQSTGHGFGSRILPGMANMLRVVVSEAAEFSDPELDIDDLVQASFDVDDQTPEDLALALDHLRAVPGILDVSQRLAHGKKGRAQFQIQVLLRPEAERGVLREIFIETTTLGVRLEAMRRVKLRRRESHADVGGQPLAVKIAVRPHAETAKVEADELRDVKSHSARARLRAIAERTDADAS
jgi:uncharacterized protein (DUF111 family)